MHVSVSDDVLHLNRINFKQDAWKMLSHHVQNMKAGNTTVQIRLAPCQHHLARGKQ
jgi:hypothetical protein